MCLFLYCRVENFMLYVRNCRLCLFRKPRPVFQSSSSDLDLRRVFGRINNMCYGGKENS